MLQAPFNASNLASPLVKCQDSVVPLENVDETI